MAAMKELGRPLEMKPKEKVELGEDHVAWFALEASRVEPGAIVPAASDAFAATNRKTTRKSDLGWIWRIISFLFWV